VPLLPDLMIRQNWVLAERSMEGRVPLLSVVGLLHVDMPLCSSWILGSGAKEKRSSDPLGAR
jgi:hypothetical protein